MQSAQYDRQADVRTLGKGCLRSCKGWRATFAPVGLAGVGLAGGLEEVGAGVEGARDVAAGSLLERGEAGDRLFDGVSEGVEGEGFLGIGRRGGESVEGSGIADGEDGLSERAMTFGGQALAGALDGGEEGGDVTTVEVASEGGLLAGPAGGVALRLVVDGVEQHEDAAAVVGKLAQGVDEGFSGEGWGERQAARGVGQGELIVAFEAEEVGFEPDDQGIAGSEVAVLTFEVELGEGVLKCGDGGVSAGEDLGRVDFGVVLELGVGEQASEVAGIFGGKGDGGELVIGVELTDAEGQDEQAGSAGGWAAGVLRARRRRGRRRFAGGRSRTGPRR